jgi:ABC-type multidrug transport system permease subunit
MLKGWFAIYYREVLILWLRRRRYIATLTVSPLLYLTAFSYAVGDNFNATNHTYIEFLIPGLAAMASMLESYSIASEINIARFYWKIFEEFQAAPVSEAAYVLAEVAAGVTRAMISVSIIVVLGLPFGVFLDYGLLFWFAIILNAYVFSTLAIIIAMIVRGHADQFMLSNFIITPMAFLGGTFFPLDRFPEWVQFLLNFVPITHASNAVRSAAFNQQVASTSYVILFALGTIFFLLAIRVVKKARD